MLLIKVEEVITAKTADDVPLDQGLEVQAQVEVESGVKEDILVAGVRDKMISKEKVPKPPTITQ